MISKSDKLKLLKDFLGRDYYCNMSIPRERSEIITLRDTLSGYINWCDANVGEPSPELLVARTQAGFAVDACESHLSRDDYTDLTFLAESLDDLHDAVKLLTPGAD